MARSALRSCSVYSRICTMVNAIRVVATVGARYIVPLHLHCKAFCYAAPAIRYRIDWRTMREPGWMPKPLPPRGTPLGNTPLPLEGRGAGPAAPPPATAIGGAPNDTGAEGNEPMYCE